MPDRSVTTDRTPLPLPGKDQSQVAPGEAKDAAPSRDRQASVAQTGGKHDASDAPVPVPNGSPANNQSTDRSPENRSDDSHSRPSWLAAIPCWLFSLVVHTAILLLLAFLTLPLQQQVKVSELKLGVAVDPELAELPVFALVQSPQADQPPVETVDPIGPMEESNTLSQQTLQLSDAVLPESAARPLSLAPLGGDVARQQESFREIGTFSGQALAGRDSALRARMLREAGGTEGSEAAVVRALDWLKRHQNPDGSWSFAQIGTLCPCENLTPPGPMAASRLLAAPNASTAMALLPFLGAGHTHLKGPYKAQVNAGLYFLLSSQRGDGSFYEPGGQLYSHGLCAIVLTEAYAMTQDPALMKPAQAAINYIAVAQDPVGGGWRYVPRQPGDTSVVGWQLMALKSGHMAYLNIPPQTIVGATRFLDSVQSDGGAAYGYMQPGDRPPASACSAIGLLCRMYLGWPHDHAGIQQGVKTLSRQGPSAKDMYYNYYATQVMRQYGSTEWERWNATIRDWLIEQQVKPDQNKHMAGSWNMKLDHHVERGGRLYNTSLAAMILEVYYRYLPIYQMQATEDEFAY